MPASVYITVSWSGETSSPWRSTSSAVLTIDDEPVADVRLQSVGEPAAPDATGKQDDGLVHARSARTSGRRSIVSRSNGAGIRTMIVEKPSSR